jgi:hypothetical protein
MALFTVVQTVSAISSGSQASVTTSGITTTSGNLLVAIIYNFGNGIGGTPITDSNSNTWAQAIASTGTSRGWGAMYYVANCTGGAAHTFTFTPSSSNFINITVYEITGAATSSVLGNTSTSTAASGSRNSGSITASGGVDEIFIGAGGSSAVGTLSAPTSVPLWWLAHNNGGTASTEGRTTYWREVAAGGSDSFAYSASNSGNETVMIAGFKVDPAIGGGGGGDGVSRARFQRRM